MIDFPYLPFEVTDKIVSEVDSPADLLALALTSSYFCSAVIPRHLHYRVIRCSITEGLHLWRAFIYDKALARNVRVLEIESHDPNGLHGSLAPSLRFPSDFPPAQLPLSMVNPREPILLNHEKITGPQELELGSDSTVLKACERIFLEALRNITSLVRFQWGYVHPDPCIVAKSDFGKEDVWMILSSIPTLRDLEVGDWHRDTSHDPIYESAIWRISNLASFKYRTFAHSGTKARVDLDKCRGGLLERDPFLPLQTLLLRFEFEDENEDVYAPPFNEILCAAHWNSLRRLQLEEICCDMAPSVAFLEAHPTIEELSIDRSFGVDEVDFGDDEKPIVIDTPVLPNLRRLRAPNGWIVAILKSHPDRIPPVEDLRGLHMPTDDQRQTILDLLKRMPDLRRIALHESSIVQDLHALSLAVPQLTWIELHPRSLFDGFGPGFALKERRLSDQQLTKFVDALALFRNLFAFHGVCVFREGDDRWNTRVSDRFTQRCTRLRRVDVWRSACVINTRWNSQIQYDKYIRLHGGDSGTWAAWNVVDQDDPDWLTQ